jgi:hypothetical protein
MEKSQNNIALTFICNKQKEIIKKLAIVLLVKCFLDLIAMKLK